MTADCEGSIVVKNPSRARPMTADRLLKGSSGPGGTRIRLARPGDTGQVTQLLELVGIRLDPAAGTVIETGTVATTLLLGLDHGADAMLRPLSEAVAADRPEDAMARTYLDTGRRGPGRVSAGPTAGRSTHQR